MGDEAFGDGANYADILAELAPDLDGDITVILSLQAMSVMPLITNELLTRAERLIVSLAISDFDDLLRQVQSGSGRAAMRSARSLIEHCINFCTTLASAEASRRYMRHLSRGQILMAESEFLTPLLNRKEKARVAHRQRKILRVAKTEWDSALQEYGKEFARSWHRSTLADRAKAEDLDHLYDAYRLASNVAHGSSAGAFGHYFVSTQGAGSYGMGRVPELVPLALLIGVESQLLLLERLGEAEPSLELDAARSTILHSVRDHFEHIWHAANSVTQSLEQRFEAGDPGTVSVLCFSRTGRRRWYVTKHPFEDRWFRATETEFANGLADDLSTLVRDYISNVGEFSEGGWAAILIPRLTLPVDTSRATIPANAIYPRLELAEGRSEWRIALRADPTGKPEFSGSLVGYDKFDAGGLLDTESMDAGIEWENL